VGMKLHDSSTHQNTWCVRIAQRTGWSIIIKAAMDARRFHLLLLLCHARKDLV
jgi:hypothetical protein